MASWVQRRWLFWFEYSSFLVNIIWKYVFSLWGFSSSFLLPTSCRGCPESYSICCFLCLQAEGGKKAEAVATVVAAVDLARVRQPVHAEGGQAEEEEEAVEAETRQQAAMTVEKHVVATKTLPSEPPAAIAVTFEQHGVQVSQVGTVCRIHIRYDI